MQDLHLEGLQHGVDSIHNLCIEGFKELKHLRVQNSPSFQNVVCSIENVECATFIALESLFLENLNNLKEICRGYLALESFSKLKILKVDNCGEIKHLFPSSMKRIISQLEEIEISSCHLMQQIVADAEVDEDGDEISDDTKVKSCNLRRLTLRNLPKMMSFYRTGDDSVDFFDGLQILFPSLEKLTVVSCGLTKIWHNEHSKESFCKLASIIIQDCEKLSHIFPSNMIEVFQSLKMIEVVNCPSLESLMEHVAVDTKKRPKRLVFLNLNEVKLWDLPRLDALITSSSQATLSLPNLTTVSLCNCHSLKYLFTYDTSGTLDKLEMLDVSDCNKMREVVAMEESEERKLKAMKFSRLQTLKLCSLKSLISFSSGNCAYEFPSLKNLSILECTELKAFILRRPAPSVETVNEESASFDESPHSFFDEKVVFPNLEELHLTAIQSRVLWENEMPNESICELKVLEVKQCPNLLNVIPSFTWKKLLQSMKSLIVEECPRVRNLFTMSMAKSLVQLEYLGLGGCGEMEYIVAREEEKPEEAPDIIVIPQLVTLYLHKMIKLRSFCHGKHISEWPSLKEFTVEDCKAVEVILGDAGCRRLQGSIPTQQPLLLVEKVCAHSSLIGYLVSCP
ncbi:uncharacterized protein LOC120290648 [Eucalyptus grandis]|uniref:uncharacterized protein LOC120290648 n=1 Tax=Eucalyptus grandis TaxID=71139 RepID=UPI00192E7ABD|nr:uncharacterized protein LOC120290648 [Eucalyptus grandis]